MTETNLRRRLSELLPAYEKYADEEYCADNIAFSQFDYYIVNRLSLFVGEKDFDFERLEVILKSISDAMPSIIHIFEKPYLHLKETEELLPIEAVRKINADTLGYAAVHSQLWDGGSPGELRPRRLMTEKIDDDYAIYENRLFAATVNRILEYLEKNGISLRNRILTSRTLNFNLLEHLNHRNYFLGLGQLYTGYSRNFEDKNPRAVKDYSAILKINRALRSRLHYRVYRNNRNTPDIVHPKTTNVLLMNRYYNSVYRLNTFLREANPLPEPLSDEGCAEFYRRYSRYCAAMLLFSVINFGFSCEADTRLDLCAPDCTFTCGRISLRTETVREGFSTSFRLTFDGGKKYSVLLDVMNTANDTLIGSVDETVSLVPVMGNDADAVAVSVTDVNSFRRIQQIILRGMIYSDTVLDTCPFCGYPLEKNGKTGYYCGNCAMEISLHECSGNGKAYYATSIRGLSPDYEAGISPDDISSCFYYRNITAVTPEGDFVCPYCGKVEF